MWGRDPREDFVNIICFIVVGIIAGFTVVVPLIVLSVFLPTQQFDTTVYCGSWVACAIALFATVSKLSQRNQE